MEEKMIKRINKEIEWVKKMYDKQISSDTHMINIARLNGMIELLSIATEKSYYYDENGLHEKQ